MLNFPLVKKAIPYVLLLAMAVAVIVIKKCKNDGVAATNHKSITDRVESSSGASREREFDRRISYLQYSKHAKCRMECRQITKEEVEETMRQGKINYGKSDIRNARCPRYAVEEVTGDNQRVRIVFAQCNNYTEVVTVIDLDKEWECACPGDDDKYKNRN
jgi:hypothetical protein